jgi:outer membrane protein OmpA-like peptidoglycan-associated protein
VAILGAFASGCAAPGRNTAIGAGAGAATGAAVGGIVGHQSHKTGQGAAIGAAAGALLGSGIGYYLDRQKAELDKVAETKRTEEGLLLNLKNDILFDTDSAALKPAAKDQLAEIAGILAKYPKDAVTVKGHTDSTGEAKHNQVLSEKRAAAVKGYLAEKGVSPQSMVARGFGESLPVASNDTTEGRAKNRRVELDIRVEETKAE